MDYMFNNCINLKFVNCPPYIEGEYIPIISSKFMFNNCITLVSIDLSAYGFGSDEIYPSYGVNNMFSNCISLKSINAPHAINFENYNMSYMFYNCTSLTSIYKYLHKYIFKKYV